MFMHKDAKHVALNYETHFAETHFARIEVGHWPAVDGRTDWASFDTADIF
jgi:hypothetical protein